MPTVADDVDERPLICNAFSVNGILDGRKTQTRRIVKPQPDHVLHDGQHPVVESPIEVVEDGELVEKTHADNGKVFVDEISSPYGREGSILWVREAFRMPARYDGTYTPKEYVSRSGYTQGMPGFFRYEADEKRAFEVAGNPTAPAVEWGRKRPSIHMPRELCRIRLRVEDVRVERIQDISDEDVFAEGIEYADGYGCRAGDSDVWYDFPDRAFAHLWNDIHGDGAWGRNEWVWCVSFSRIDDDR